MEVLCCFMGDMPSQNCERTSKKDKWKKGKKKKENSEEIVHFLFFCFFLHCVSFSEIVVVVFLLDSFD